MRRQQARRRNLSVVGLKENNCLLLSVPFSVHFPREKEKDGESKLQRGMPLSICCLAILKQAMQAPTLHRGHDA